MPSSYKIVPPVASAVRVFRLRVMFVERAEQGR